MAWNSRTISTGTAGRFEPERVDAFLRNGWTISSEYAGGLLKRDFLAKSHKSADGDEVLSNMSSLGLVDSEYVVLCKKTSEQINRAPTTDSIMAMGEHGIKCSRCNKLITDEHIEEFLTTTDIGNRMVDSSHWMTPNLVESLRSFGIEARNILVNVCEGPEEIDAMVSLGGKLILFELKDSQFSLGHAYAFQSRLGLYEADVGVIWATGGVAPEVKEHFSRVKPDAEIRYIENAEDLVPKLSGIIGDVRWQFAEKELRSLLPSGIITVNIPRAIIGDLKAADSPKHNHASG